MHALKGLDLLRAALLESGSVLVVVLVVLEADLVVLEVGRADAGWLKGSPDSFDASQAPS